MLDPIAPLFNAVRFARHDGPLWKVLWPTHRQAAILADRSIPKPRTRGEAASLIAAIAVREGWER